ncbi:TetR/AcrR family transcriptional regulator [Virgibacillus xinjiangensis]|uniref:TetR/AcrR family transcriptional regulator n=1 Tax=Virgibacillus xinjiangensis TaxID=393090 RepID=A0ABV7CWH6_9BACI
MSAEKIKLVAADQFSQYGFHDASLADIAEQVGIKKPSIYAHFKSKKDLFLHVLEDSYLAELEFFSTYFQQTSDLELEEQLRRLITYMITRYHEEVSFRFWLRSGFFPPQELYDVVMERFYAYLDNCESIITDIFHQHLQDRPANELDAEEAGIAFIGLLDSLFIEMQYGGLDRARRRVDASLEVFFRGMKAQA